MTVKKKIDKNDRFSDSLRYINAGGQVRADCESQGFWKMISLRVPLNYLKDIESILKKRLGLSRTAWILEAIQEKLERESNGISKDP